MAEDVSFALEFRGKRFDDASAGFFAFADSINKDWDGSVKVLSSELKSFLDTVATALSRRHGNAWPGGTTARTLSKRSGNSIASIMDSVVVSGATFNTVTGKIGGDFPLHVHEYGATIRAKRGKYLTIPLPPALDNRGVPIKKSARDWDNTFVAKSKAGNLLIFQKRGTKIVPLYVLKETVRIPPRLEMGATLRTGIPFFVSKVMDKMVASVLAGAG